MVTGIVQVKRFNTIIILPIPLNVSVVWSVYSCGGDFDFFLSLLPECDFTTMGIKSWATAERPQDLKGYPFNRSN